MSEQWPPVEDRRAMLQGALKEMRTLGYSAQINIMVAEAQNATHMIVQTERGPVKVSKEAQLDDLKKTVENARLAAARLEKEIAALGE